MNSRDSYVFNAYVNLFEHCHPVKNNPVPQACSVVQGGRGSLAIVYFKILSANFKKFSHR